MPPLTNRDQNRPLFHRKVWSRSVASKACRRRFTAEYKLRVLREAERGTAPGAIGALLRREGLYSSHLAKWREQQAASLAPRRRGRNPQGNPLAVRVAQLERETVRLQRELEKAHIIIEVQKKVAALLGRPILTPDPEENS